MRLTARSVAWLLPLLLSGCMHKTTLSQIQPLAPPIEDPPPPKPDSAPANLPQPVISIPKSPPPILVVPPEAPKVAQKHKKPVPKPTQPTQAAAPPTTQVASAGAPPEVPAIGQLTSGEPDNTKRQAASSITEVEKGLGSITRKLSEQEEKTSTQIREYLKQAKTALNSGDVEAANTLALKAKVLLGELGQ